MVESGVSRDMYRGLDDGVGLGWNNWLWLQRTLWVRAGLIGIAVGMFIDHREA